MRKPKKPDKEVNCLVPFNLSGNESDCFGKEFSATSSDCNMCHDKEFCGTIFTDFVQKKAKEIESKVPEILQDVDFDLIDKEKLEQQLLQAYENNQPFKVSELLQLVGETAHTVDNDLITEWVKNFIKNSAVKTQNGIVISR